METYIDKKEYRQEAISGEGVLVCADMEGETVGVVS